MGYYEKPKLHVLQALVLDLFQLFHLSCNYVANTLSSSVVFIIIGIPFLVPYCNEGHVSVDKCM